MSRGSATRSRAEAVSWSIRGLYLVAWAALGIFLWVPWLLGAAVRRAVARMPLTRSGDAARPTGTRLPDMADFYRGFVRAVDAIEKPPASLTPIPSRDPARARASRAFEE